MPDQIAFSTTRTMIGQLVLPPDLGRTVLVGECLIRDPVNQDEGNLPTAITEIVYGFLDEQVGGDPGQDLPVRMFRHGERRIRVQDNATVVLFAQLGPSGSDAGSVVTAVSTSTVCAVALQAISSGTTEQYILAQIFTSGLPQVVP